MIRFVALCGYPKAGKSEVQRIMAERYDVVSIDDSQPLREAAKALYGLTDWHVSTQDGKKSLVKVGGELLTVRQVLGRLGKYLEKDDPFHLPRLAVRTCLAENDDRVYSFGSVRMNQPGFFKDQGDAIVIEVTRAGCFAENDFDEYERDAIDFSIENTLDTKNPKASRARLEAAVAEMLDPILKRIEMPCRSVA